MKTTFTLRILTITLAILASCGYSLNAQILVPLEKRMATAQLVVEGEVVHSHCFIGTNRTIYTSRIVRIDIVIKGQPAADTLEIILEGGTVANQSLSVSHQVEMGPKSSGVFFLNPLGATHPAKLGQQKVAYDVYAGTQGFIEYSRFPGATSAVEPFHVYNSIATDLYPLLGLSGAQAPVKHKPVPFRTAGGPIIDSIRPLEITAGTRTTLSIYGHGFQDVKGTVLFPNANQGGAGFMIGDSTDVQSWADTLIRVWVPSAGPLPGLSGTAGTGRVTIQNMSGDTTSSNDRLHVLFGIRNGRNLDPLFAIGVSRFVTLFDLDSEVGADTSGGYTFHFTNAFSSNDNAEAAFRQAIRQWRCATGVNFKIDADTSLNVILNDSVNLVRWDDQPDTLPAGVPAFTRVFFVNCDDGVEEGYVFTGMEITFNDAMPWNFDTTAVDSNELDFYSVALHEIGHAHGLNHVIDHDEVMHYNIGYGDRRALLTTYALDAGQWVMDSSTVPRVGCYGPMVPVAFADCNLLPVSPQFSTSLDLRLFPNPTADVFQIQIMDANAAKKFDFKLFDSAGNCISGNLFELSPTAQNAWVADLKNLPGGLYFAQIQYGNALSNHKIIRIK